MARIFVTTLPGAKLAVIRLAPGQDEVLALAKTMFELTRPPTPAGMAEHFNPNNPAHRRGPPVREMDDSLLPADRTQRDRWEEFGGSVRVRPL
mgnify:FL=1